MLVRAAQVLRAYHDASADFLPRAGAVWQWPAREPAQVVCHNDFAPYNLMFEGEELTGVIDFDLASPGPRVWDMGYTAYRFVPLTDPGNPDVPYPGRGRAGAPAGGVLCGLRRRAASARARSSPPRSRICASSSRSSCAAPPPATPRSRRCWPAATPRSTSATSRTSNVYSAEAIRSTISATSSGLVPKLSRTKPAPGGP